MIEFTCDCGKHVRAEDNDRGRTVACPACGQDLVVPDGAQDRVSAARPAGRADFAEDEGRGRRRRSDDEGREPRRPVAGERPKSHALLYTCIALGVCAVVGCPAVVLLALLFPAVTRIREAAARLQATNNVKQMTLAVQNYEITYGSYPLAYTHIDLPPAAPQPGMSWRVAILPYVDVAENLLYNQYDPKETWDGTTNRPLNAQQVRIYQFPRDPPSAQTYFQVFVTAPGKSPHSMFTNPADAKNQVKFTDIPDGSANTILIAEAATTVPWMSPQDMSFDPALPPPRLGSHFSAGSIVGMADGSVRLMSPSVNPTTLKALITRDGGETIIDPNW